MKEKCFFIFVSCAMILAIFAGCSASSDGSDDIGQSQWNPYDKYYQILLRETELTLNVGETYQLSVEIDSKTGDDIVVYYGSDNDRVVSVSESGLVSAKSRGSANIFVSAENASNSCWCYITVNDPNMLTPENAAEILGEDYKYKTTIVIPEGITGIASDVWGGCNVENIIIPNTVTYIADWAFSYCSRLKNIVIPSSVTSIGNYAFCDCMNLTDVYIDNLESYEQIEFGSGWDDGYSRPDCYGATLHIGEAFEIPPEEDIIILTKDNVYKILTDDYYSYGYVEIPETVKEIGDCVFEYCSSLQNITIPSSVTSIGRNAFLFCNNLNAVNIESVESWLGINFADSEANPLHYAKHLYVNGEELINLVIPDGTAKIKDYAFYGYKNLQSIKIPASLISLGYESFRCYNYINTVYVETHETWRNLDFSMGNYYITDTQIIFGDDGEVDITVKFPDAEKDDVPNLEWTKNGNVVTISAESGHSSYAWFVDMQKQSTVESALEFDTTNKKAGLYSVMVVIDGKYSATATIEVLK